MNALVSLMVNGQRRTLPSPAPLTPDAEALYRRLVSGGPMPLADAMDDARTLLELGLATVTDNGLTAMPPRLPLESLANRHRAQAAATEDAARRLASMWVDRDARPFVEVLETTAATMQAFEWLQREAVDEVCGLWLDVDRPGERIPIAPSPSFPQAIGRGVRYRVVYPTAVLDNDQMFAAVQSCAALGEQVRLHPQVPMKLLIADRGNAVITVAGQGGQLRQGLAVHPSGLLDALIGLFESYWQQGQPLRDAVDPPEHTDDSRRLLELLALGLTDESIAREVGVSERTVGRRVARLQHLLGASSRFQLGVQACSRGWL